MAEAEPQHTIDVVARVIGGKYKLVRLIGRGGMGAVYEAENTWTKRRVATKILRPEYAADREALRRFMQEAQSASQIAHPNIIDTLDLGLEPSDGSLYTVQELLTGIDLRRRLLQTPTGISVAETFDVLVPIMSALVSAHTRGVVHRDLKPENIFLARSTGGATLPKLIDFGVSKVLSAIAEKGHQTGIGTAIGTPRYMSPEQIRADASIDGRSDVWSIGVVLYELLTGKNPFEAASSFLSVNRVLHDTVAPIASLAPGVPQSVARLVHRALERDVEQRPSTMRAFLGEVFACEALGPGLEDRHRASLLYLTPADEGSTEHAPAHFSLVTQLTPPTQPTMAVPDLAHGATARAQALSSAAPRPAARRRLLVGLVIAAIALLAGLAVIASRAVPRSELSAPPSAVVPDVPAPISVTPPRRGDPIRMKSREPSPTRPATRKPTVSPARPQEGANKAPIVE